MRLSAGLMLVLLILTLPRCKKDTPVSCINNTQQPELLSALKPYAYDSTLFSPGERTLMYEIRDIANDIEPLSAALSSPLSAKAKYDTIYSRFRAHADEVKQLAANFYAGYEPKVILAQNAFVLMSYDALNRAYPEFMWTKLGVFAANEVRSGLVLALSMRYNLLQSNVHVPVNGIDMADAMLLSSQVLIDGQIDVLTDIGSMGILNKITGPAALKNESWLTPEAREGFTLQQEAEEALFKNNCGAFMDLQTAAAIRFGAHEQIYILQPMWDEPIMQQFAALDQMMIQLTGHHLVFFGDIFVGTNKTTEANKGYTIHLPSNVNDLSNAGQRVDVAINGFNTLNRLRKDPQWSYWIDYSQIKIGYCIGIYASKNL